MIVKVLAENTSASTEFISEHGLSLYIETENNKILFDTGSGSAFAENAKRLGVDLSLVDLAVLSHGHYDHAGGLKTFFNLNSRAEVYVHKEAFAPHYANRSGGEKDYIGADQSLLENERFVFCDDSKVIDDELELFAAVGGKRFVPSGNKDLLVKEGDSFRVDPFLHEQNLIVRQGNKTMLVAGCAHRGIVNIVDGFKEKFGFFPDYVIGGFHLCNRTSGQSESPDNLKRIGRILLETGAEYFTGHCTGIDAYNILKSVMGVKIEYLSTGSVRTFKD